MGRTYPSEQSVCIGAWPDLHMTASQLHRVGQMLLGMSADVSGPLVGVYGEKGIAAITESMGGDYGLLPVGITHATQLFVII
jgi:hypothetical protein